MPLLDGDRLEFLCDYYAYDNSFDSIYTLGSELTVQGAPELINLSLDADNLIPSYRITDIYGNTYWLRF